MALFISGGFLAVLLLATSCFTLPIVDQPSSLSNTNIPKSDNVFTTETIVRDNKGTVKKQVIIDDESIIPPIQILKKSLRSVLDPESSFTTLLPGFHHESEEPHKDVMRSRRSLDTDKSISERDLKVDSLNLEVTTVSISERDLNVDSLNLEVTTLPTLVRDRKDESVDKEIPTTSTLEHHEKDELVNLEVTTSWISERDEKADFDSTKIEANTKLDDQRLKDIPRSNLNDVQIKRRGESVLGAEPENVNEEIPSLTTRSFYEKREFITSERYTPEPELSSGHQFSQITGLVPARNEVKPIPLLNKVTQVPQASTTLIKRNQIEDEESKPPVVQLDQNPSKQVVNLTNGKREFEKNVENVSDNKQDLLNSNKLIVTKPLTQGQQPAQSEETKSNN